MHPDTFYRVALNQVTKVGPILSRVLYDHFGSAEAIFLASPRELKLIEGIGAVTIKSLQRTDLFNEAETIMRFAEKHDVRVIHYSDSDYPDRLRRQHRAPALLYYRGTAVLGKKRSVAIIGTRRASERGIAQTERLLGDLQMYDPLIISGLAYGVDICAHRAALQNELSTVGVLGSGLNKIYPASHCKTAREMMHNGGLLSTYPHYIGPEREHFPARNRIVAMLADIIIVVESEIKGGSIITADMGREMGKPIGAFPGRWDDKKSAGCNAIIKKPGGHLIESASDIAKLLNWQKSTLHHTQGKLFQELSSNEKAIVQELGKADGVRVDDLGRQLEWPNSKLAVELLGMEVKGLIKALPGQRYRLAY